jgi:transposase
MSSVSIAPRSGGSCTGSGSVTKKVLLAAERTRPDVALARRLWITRRQPFMRNALERLVFIDETSVKTNMVKATGWAPVGERLQDHAPFGHWRTQTFVAALRNDRLDAPWVIDGAMNRQMFERYVETQLAPSLRPGDVVILDNLSSHKSPRAATVLKDIGAWFLFLPPYSPDLNPIEMAFSKLKSLIRKAAARTYDDLWATVGRVCDLFSEAECFNYFQAAGYRAD